MGVGELWKILPLDERVLFPVFVSRFLQQNGRPPRFAIDAYMFMFWSLFSNGETDDLIKEGYDIKNFMAKLWYLVRNNVSFVVVFDGTHKPEKLRNGCIPGFPASKSFDEMLEFFLRSSPENYSENLRVIEKLKFKLLRNKMDWVQAPAEAEAECAWLQRLGVVDYVISDDSDTLVFGATAVLRWFNRVKYYDDNKNPVVSSDYYVTPARMCHITEETNLTRDHLVMIAVLRGGDYSKGADNIGITRAKEIALCGTTSLVKQPRKTAQDFGSFCDIKKIFVDTFLEKSCLNPSNPYFGRKLACDRHESLLAFNKFLNEFLQENAPKVFGRKTNFENKVEILDYYAMLYFFPFVNSKIFKFTPHSTSFGEPNHVIRDLKSEANDFRVPRFNYVVSPEKIGLLVMREGNYKFEELEELKLNKIPLPRERKDHLKAFVLKFLRDKTFWRFIIFERIKEFEGVSLAVLKFNKFELNNFVYHQRKDVELDSGSDEENLLTETIENEGLADSILPEENNKKKLMEVTVPLESVSFISPEYVKSFKNQAQRRSPQKKKPAPPPQKTTLDSIWPSMLPTRTQGIYFDQPPTSPTPQKRTSVDPRPMTHQIAREVILEPNKQNKVIVDGLKDSSQHENAVKKKPIAKKHYRRKKGNKSELAPGQTTLTLFLLSRRAGVSEKEALFVTSEEETDQKDESYQNMKNQFVFAPALPGPNANTVEKERPFTSPEGSPTKRHRKEMWFSPENSPVKARPETKEPW